MVPFPTNPHRLVPYKSFKFQLVLDGDVVAGVSRIGGLRRRTEVVPHRDGGMPSHLLTAPGATSFDPIVLERGITEDTTFRDWAELAYSPQGDAAMSLRDFRKDLRINLLNQQGSVVLSYMVFRAWVSEFEALPELDANGNEIAIERIVLQHDGWEQDRAVSPPVEH